MQEAIELRKSGREGGALRCDCDSIHSNKLSFSSKTKLKFRMVVLTIVHTRQWRPGGVQSFKVQRVGIALKLYETHASIVDVGIRYCLHYRASFGNIGIYVVSRTVDEPG